MKNAHFNLLQGFLKCVCRERYDFFHSTPIPWSPLTKLLSPPPHPLYYGRTKCEDWKLLLIMPIFLLHSDFELGCIQKKKKNGKLLCSFWKKCRTIFSLIDEYNKTTSFFRFASIPSSAPLNPKPICNMPSAWLKGFDSIHWGISPLLKNTVPFFIVKPPPLPVKSENCPSPPSPHLIRQFLPINWFFVNTPPKNQIC